MLAGTCCRACWAGGKVSVERVVVVELSRHSRGTIASQDSRSKVVSWGRVSLVRRAKPDNADQAGLYEVSQYNSKENLLWCYYTENYSMILFN